MDIFLAVILLLVGMALAIGLYLVSRMAASDELEARGIYRLDDPRRSNRGGKP